MTLETLARKAGFSIGGMLYSFHQRASCARFFISGNTTKSGPMSGPCMDNAYSANPLFSLGVIDQKYKDT